MGTQVYDVAIIGGGPAGYSAALYCARAGLKTVTIEKMSAGGQMALTDIIENYPGFDEGIDGFTLGFKMQQGAEKFGTETLFGQVLSAELTGKIKKLITDSKTVLSKTVIIATGADPKPLGLEGEKELIGRGLHYCAHCDGRFYKGKTVAVIGGGNSAVSDALYLSNLAEKVYLIHRRDTLRASKIYHGLIEQTENIKFIKDSRVIKFISNGKVTGAETENTLTKEVSKLDLDGVFISIGRRPCTEIFKGQLSIDEQGYIIADETTKTSVSGVFAAGDVRTKALRQVVTAAADGAVASHFAEEYLAQI